MLLHLRTKKIGAKNFESVTMLTSVRYSHGPSLNDLNIQISSLIDSFVLPLFFCFTFIVIFFLLTTFVAVTSRRFRQDPCIDGLSRRRGTANKIQQSGKC